MDLTFLGTGAGKPSSRRNVTSIALRFLEDRGSIWLIDCGEGTQHQMLRTSIKLSKLEKLFVTHLHGDHLFGIPGLLTSRSHQGAQTPISIFGPKGIKDFIETSLHTSQSHLDYTLEVTEITNDYLPGNVPLYEDDRYRLFAARLDHRIESFGFRVEEKEKRGKLNDQKLSQLGVPAGPIFGQLKQGMDVILDNGMILKASEFLGRSVPGRVIAIMGDTRACDHAVRLAYQADVLVHEATYSRNQQNLADEYHHSTTIDAAETALLAKARALIITHISSRYQDESSEQLLGEAQEIYPNTYLAEDLWSYSIARRNP